MEDLQDALQSILSDPARMAQVAALAESLGLKPPDEAHPVGTARSRPQEATGNRQQGSGIRDQGSEAAGRPPEAETSQNRHSERSEESVPPSPQGIPNALNGLDLTSLMSHLSAGNGAEERVLSALRPALSQTGQGRVDRALRAARLSRLAARLLRSRENGHV